MKRPVAHISPSILVELFLLFIPIDAISQRRPYLTFEHFSVESGLSHSQVRYVYQDRKGFLWFGTDGGLNRYDGYTFKAYRHDPNDSTSLSMGVVNCVYEDRFGFIWASTSGGGLNRYDPQTGRFRRYVNNPNDSTSLSGDGVGPIFEDRSGEFWIGAHGINRYDRERDSFVRYIGDEKNSRTLRSNWIEFLFEDHKGVFWVGTQKGLHIFDRTTGSFRYFLSDRKDPASISSNFISGCADADSILWVGTSDGLNRFDKRTGKFTHYRYDPGDPFSLGNDDVSDVYKDRNGILWIGTWQYGGLNLMDPSKPRPRFFRFKRELDNPNSISENRIFSILEDRSGNIWIATHRGLNKVSRTRKFDHFLAGRQVRALYIDSRGLMWIGSMGEGVTIMDRQRRIVKTYTHDDGDPGSISSNFIYCFYEDRQGNMWIGTYEKGLNKLVPGKTKFLRFEQDAKNPRGLNEHIRSVVEDRGGTIWATGWLRAERFERAGFTNHPNVPGRILADGKGGLWTFDSAGAAKFETAGKIGLRFAYDTTNMPPGKFSQVEAIRTDRSGVLWCAVNDWGLVRFDERSRKWRRYTTDDGLSHNHVHTMEIDREGYLWLGTENGLSRFDPRSESFRVFLREDGVPSANFYEGQAVMNEDGEMFFGTTNGVISFFPDDLRPVGPPPSVVLTGFYTLHRPFSFNRDASEIREIEITYRENVFSFEAAVLDFTNPAKNQYAYIMEGFDKDWTYAGTRRYITYTNLNPGTYTLRVKGANSDGTWNEKGIAVRLTITPPFWFEWWFLSVVGILILTTIIYLYNWRVDKLLEIERTRDGIARDLHDDVASTLSSIALYSASLGSKVQKPSKESKQLMEKISSLSLEAVDSMSDIVWSLAPQHDMLNEMLIHMRDLASQLLTTHGIEYSITLHPLRKDEKLDIVVRKNIYLIFKEGLNNALKHARATFVSIQAGVNDGWFELILSDNGKGFIAPQKEKKTSGENSARGHGLRNMQYRAGQIRAEFTISSTPLWGTTIVVRKRMT